MPGKSSKGILYLIPVPIAVNNPGDSLPLNTLQKILSLRVFIVEDIRTARRFMRAAGYQGNFDDIIFLILNEHTHSGEIKPMLDYLLSGQHVGLLSEAGSPCVADPGSDIVAAAHSHNIQVIPLTGPSSILQALMASGFNGQHFAFLGYLPVKNPARTNKIREIENRAYHENQTQIFIEAPYRNQPLFENIIQVCRDQTLMCIAAEIGSENEMIISKPIAWWKKNPPEIHKKPAVFLLYR